MYPTDYKIHNPQRAPSSCCYLKESKDRMVYEFCIYLLLYLLKMPPATTVLISSPLKKADLSKSCIVTFQV